MVLPLDEFSQVKCYQAGGAKPRGETQTAKLIEKGKNGPNTARLRGFSELSPATIRLTNLIRTARQKKVPLANCIKSLGLITGYFIISVSAKFDLLGSNTQSETKVCRNPSRAEALAGNYGIT
jgi:hypothetical protein